MSSESGFTLIETLVATLIGVALVVAIGVLGKDLIRHRVNADSSSAATTLAEMRMEQLLATAKNDPAAADVAAGPHGPLSVDATGLPSIGGPYSWRWEVADNSPYAGSKRITVTVTHATNSFARCELVTYFKVS